MIRSLLRFMESKEYRGYPTVLCAIALTVLALSCAGFGTRPDAPPLKAAGGLAEGGVEMDRKPGGEGGAYAPDQVLVKFREGIDRGAVQALEKDLGLRTLRVVSRSNTYLMEIAGEDSVERMIERLKKIEAVEYAEPNYVRSGR